MLQETYAGCLPKRRHTSTPQHYSNLSRRLSQDKTNSDPPKEKNLFETKIAHAPTKHCQRKKKLCKNGKSVVYFNTKIIERTQTLKHEQCNSLETKQIKENNDSARDYNKMDDALSRDNCRKLEEIEIFHEEQLIIKAMEKRKSFCWDREETLKSNTVRECISCWKQQENRPHVKLNDLNEILTKSVTMPNITLNSFVKLHSENKKNLINRNYKKCQQLKSV